jgi:hypothetical protein
LIICPNDIFLLMHETFIDTHGNSFAYMDCVALLEWLKTFINFLTWIMTCHIWLNYVRIFTIIILMWITYHMWLIYVIIAILKLPCEINIWIIFLNHLRNIEKQIHIIFLLIHLQTTYIECGKISHNHSRST